LSRFDRYLLSQLMMLFGFFALVLVTIYWINRAVVLFDQLISNGQTALVFLEFTALSLPNVIAIVLPVAAFVAAVYVANRLASDSELVVVQATGYSPFRLMRAVLAFGVFVMAMLAILTNVLVPVAQTTLVRRQAEISGNITSRFLTEGVFLHPADSVTVYIRQITADGELLNLFMSDARAAEQRTTYTARRALIIRSATGPKLVMFDGMAQTLRLADERLSVTRFSDFSFDIGALIDKRTDSRRAAGEVPTAELLQPGPALAEETGKSIAALIYEGHSRLAQPLLGLVAALSGFAMMLVGGFSRFGMWRQIVGAIALLILLKALDNSMASLAQDNARLWPLVYVSSVAGLAAVWAILHLSAHPALWRTRSGVRAESGA
jgi:lipopolysaccharide export system permease protein